MGYHVHLQLYSSVSAKGEDFTNWLLAMRSLGRVELVTFSHTWALDGLLGLGPITLSPHSPCSGCSQHQPFS